MRLLFLKIMVFKNTDIIKIISKIVFIFGLFLVLSLMLYHQV